MLEPEQPSKLPIGISSCLLGEPVRYDGGHKNNDYIVKTLGSYFEFSAFCPEVAIGLGVPRAPVRLVNETDGIHCVGVTSPALDVTEQLAKCADEQADWHNDICGYIFKKDSPSCGMERVKVYQRTSNKNNAQPLRNGVGIYAAQLMRNLPHLPTEEEGRLGDAGLRENFVQRVFIYHRWRTLLASKPDWHDLTTFHARHKLILMSHNQTLNRQLGHLLSQSTNADIQAFLNIYIVKLTTLLKIVPTRKNHVNVLQHIQGYLKSHLDADDKKELTDTIHQYRAGMLPLIVPITLLRHHFRKHPNEYIDRSWYLHPQPPELMLLNSL